MKVYLVMALLLGRMWVAADERVESSFLPPPTQAPRAWLGLQVAKPVTSSTAGLLGLPPGIGFVIKGMDEGGPAQIAKLRIGDVIWKLGDQMLVNEAQLAALLRLAKPGDEVIMAGFRDGKAMEVKLVLGDTPAVTRRIPGDLVDQAILPPERTGWRVISLPDRLATYATAEGRAEVRLESGVYKVNIHGPQDEVIFVGDLPADGSMEPIPETWRRRIQALRRGLDHALEGRMMPTRQARPRVVPPASPNP